MLIKKAVVLAKIEVTNNVDSIPTAAANAILVENVSAGPANQKMVEQTPVKATLGKSKPLFATMLFQVSFDVRVKGSGTVGDVPEFGQLLRACGLSETIVALTSVAYAPVSEGMESATLYVYIDGSLRKLTGCSGNVSFNGESGSAGLFSFSFTGHDSGLTDAALPNPALDATEAPIIKNSGFTVGAYAAVISKLGFDLGNEVATPVDINGADGFGEIIITDRDINGSLDPLNTLLAEHDFMDDWKTNKEMALTATVGSVAGNIYQIDMPAVSYKDASYAGRDGQQTIELPFMANEVTGDDGLAITFL